MRGSLRSETSRLHLLEELRQVKDRVLAARFGSRIDLIFEPELRLNRLAAVLMQHRSHIIHFSGHGSATGAILLVDPDHAGGFRPMDPVALRRLFCILNDAVYCVVLNSCYSAAHPQQAQALADAMGCVIGMDASIADPSAIEFAASFYEALGFGRPIEDAFNLGRQAILAMGHPGHHVPKLHSRSDADPAHLVLFAH